MRFYMYEIILGDTNKSLQSYLKMVIYEQVINYGLHTIFLGLWSKKYDSYGSEKQAS